MEGRRLADCHGKHSAQELVGREPRGLSRQRRSKGRAIFDKSAIATETLFKAARQSAASIMPRGGTDDEVAFSEMGSRAVARARRRGWRARRIGAGNASLSLRL